MKSLSTMTTAIAIQSAPPQNSSLAHDSGRLHYLDGWRGLAISLVLCAHFLPGPLGINSGRLGVDVFFSLSGFLMSNILFVKRTPLLVFYKRRISRVLPVFFLYVGVIFSIGWLTAASTTWVEFLATAAFLRTYIPASPGIWGAELPLGHLWSLNTEEHCYVFLSVIASITFLRTREFWVLMAAGMLAIVIHVIYIKIPAIAPPSGDLGTEVVASHLLISAGYFLVRDHFRPFVKPWMPIVTLLLGGFTYSAYAPWWSAMLLSPFLLAFTVNHLRDASEAFKRALAFQPLRMLGVWSYSIYIWQQPFYRFSEWFVPGGAFIGAMAAALGSYYFFEQPLRTWMNRNW
jgi:peptidoglycan/LPS O-acetylase OafA/YrhL